MSNKYSLNALIVKGYDVSLMALAENKVPSGYNEGPIGLLTWSEIMSLIENYIRHFKDKGMQEDKRTTFPLLREIIYYKREDIAKDSLSTKLLQGMFERALEQVKLYTNYHMVYAELEEKSIKDICDSERSVDTFYQATETVSRCLHQNIYKAE